METSEFKRMFDPAANDFLYKFIVKLVGNKPIPIGFLYFLLSAGGVSILGTLTGVFLRNNSQLTLVYKDYMNIINVGIIAPIGAGLLVNLYNKMKVAFPDLIENNIIIDDSGEYEKLLLRLSKLYTTKTAVYSALIISVLLNLYFMFKKSETWSGIYGGVTAYYFRSLVVINYYMIMVILYKCIITTWAFRQIFDTKFELKLQPLHPDKCGGIKTIGSLSIAMHYFFQLIILFLTMIAVFNQNSIENFSFILLFLSIIIITIFSLFFSLYKAHDKMKKAKAEILHKLHLEFQKYYWRLNKNLADKSFQIKTADNLQSINKLYLLANKMPVWPFDIHSLARFFTTVSIPVLIFLIQMLTNADSILYNLNKYHLLFKERNYGIQKNY